MTDELLGDLYTGLASEYGKTRKGVHVSDVVLCPRRTVFRNLEPMPITALELNFFSSGAAVHEALQKLTRYKPEKYETEHKVDFNGLLASIDIYDKINNVPIEAKTYRNNKILKPKLHQLRQLHAYMAIKDATKGKMLYQLLTHFGKEPFVVFNIDRTTEENDSMRQWLSAEYEFLKQALEQKNPALVRSIMYDPQFNFLCDNCPYFKKCQQINNSSQISPESDSST